MQYVIATRQETTQQSKYTVIKGNTPGRRHLIIRMLANSDYVVSVYEG